MQRFKSSELFFTIIKVPVDFFMLLLGGVAAYFLRTEIISVYRPVLFEFNLPLIKYLYIIFFVGLLFIGAYAASGMYTLRSRHSLTEEFVKIIIASSAGIMLVIIYIFLRQELFNSRFLVLGTWIFAMVFVFLGRVLLRFIQRYAVSRDFGVPKLAIIGNGRIAQHAVEEFNGRGRGYRIMKVMENLDINELQKIYNTDGLDRIVLASTYGEEETHDLIDFCHENYIDFYFIPSVHQLLTTNFSFDIVGTTPMIELQRTALNGWGNVVKRVLDLLSSSLALLVLSPFFLILGILIKLDSRGPIFVKLKRISQNKEFLLYKFRSMIATDPDGGAESLKASLMAYNERKDSPLFKLKNDPRITRVGRIIRRTRLDELPQFLNVLMGEMSLVGPRPHQPDEVAKYEKHHRKVLAIKAGATGLAQISGSSDLPFEEEVALDTFYIENWSLWLDLKIIFKTVFKMLSDRSAV